ncbi:MAG: phosphatidylglycerol lysyltransferase domain-containing protein [Gemmatimonadota bacterium]|nr:phosphatidylglycerol lysyltransferase domain-containing protein [Gemmatimonadota bacterium]
MGRNALLIIQEFGDPAVHHHFVLVMSGVTALLYLGIALFQHTAPIQRLVALGGDWTAAVVPRLLSILTFAAGAMLLFSGATPAVAGRLGFLGKVVPIPLIELSHFADNLAGAGLLLLARGVERRLDAAYHLTLSIIIAGVVLSVLRAFDYEEATFLILLALLFIPSRKYFYRKTSLIEERFTPQWIAATALVVTSSIILGFISYRVRHVQPGFFNLNYEEGRFLRATAGTMGVLIFFGAMRLLRPAHILPPLPLKAEFDAAALVAAGSVEAAAHLATLGDKRFLFNDDRTAFVMYGIHGRSWVSLGDPVAPAAQVPQLVERFISLADDHGGMAVFYKVGPVLLHAYLDHGFAVAKLGEEARVRLDDFSLEGPQRRNLRRVWRKAVDSGCSAEIVLPPDVREHIPQLRAISDAWLENKHSREKGFSLGFFDDEYVARFPVALVRREGRIIAFASIWNSGHNEELEVDLMRYFPDAPPGIMRYLLAEVMLWGRSIGYRWLNLGMAPLSGLRSAAGAPIWHQLGSAVRGYGERYYNFQGIREFKEWFYPEWEPRFLVSPGGRSRPVVLANIAGLIGGGLGGVLRK